MCRIVKRSSSAIVAKHPIGRMATADEVAAVAVFLASSDAAFMTGLPYPSMADAAVR